MAEGTPANPSGASLSGAAPKDDARCEHGCDGQDGARASLALAAGGQGGRLTEAGWEGVPGRQGGTLRPRRRQRHPDHDDRAVELLTQALDRPRRTSRRSSPSATRTSRAAASTTPSAGRAALKAEPEHADALILIGDVLLRRGDASGAREHAVWAIRTDVRDPDALRLLAAIKARESLLLGLWFRVSSVLARLGPSACSSSSPHMSPQDQPLR
ncbi:hypothetical protein WME91_43440 [Sorangium sp. So ce269]